MKPRETQGEEMYKQYPLGSVCAVCLGLLALGAGEAFAASAQDNQVLSILGRWSRATQRGTLDHVTASSADNVPGATFEGQMFYVPVRPASGSHPLYRLYRSAGEDYKDSLLAGETGYGMDQLLGAPFSVQLTGTQPLWQWQNGSTGDSLTAFDDENPTAAGYAPDRVLGYGFPRYGKEWERPVVVAGSQVKLALNLVAGGAVSELWWNGKQFINHYDYGRQIQTAMNLSRQAESANPTEAGDMFGGPATAAPGWGHGSPLLAGWSRGGSLETLCHPLQWKPQNWGGGPSNPVMWWGTIAKHVDLDFGGSPNVIRWITAVSFPSDEPYVDLEVVTAYLNSEFTRFFAYNAQTATAAEMTARVSNGGCLDPSQDERLRPAAGGVVLATADGAYALGIYHRSSQNQFGLCKFLGSGTTGRYGFDTTKWNLLWRPPQGVRAGQYLVTSYLIVGTLSQVFSEAMRLYRSGL